MRGDRDCVHPAHTTEPGLALKYLVVQLGLQGPQRSSLAGSRADVTQVIVLGVPKP